MKYFLEELINEVSKTPELTKDELLSFFSGLGSGLGIEGDDDRGVASETMSRLKAIWCLQEMFGNDAVKRVQQAKLSEQYDFKFDLQRCEVKARRGKWTYAYFYKHPIGPGCEAGKAETSDLFITITSDGFGLCWNTSNYYFSGNPPRLKNTDFGGGDVSTKKMNYYRMSDTIWKTHIDYGAWSIIDEIWGEDNS